MRRKLISLICALAIAALSISTAAAGGNVRLSNVTFGLGSLISNGTLTGLGNTDVTVVLDATGTPVVMCTNQGGNQAPGQNPPKVSATGIQLLSGNDPVRKNGKSPFGAETNDPTMPSARLAGCPNDNWTAQIVFVYWTSATITILDTNSQVVLLKQNYVCTTVRLGPGLTNGAVTCTPA